MILIQWCGIKKFSVFADCSCLIKTVLLRLTSSISDHWSPNLWKLRLSLSNCYQMAAPPPPPPPSGGMSLVPVSSGGGPPPPPQQEMHAPAQTHRRAAPGGRSLGISNTGHGGPVPGIFKKILIDKYSIDINHIKYYIYLILDCIYIYIPYTLKNSIYKVGQQHGAGLHCRTC